MFHESCRGLVGVADTITSTHSYATPYSAHDYIGEFETTVNLLVNVRHILRCVLRVVRPMSLSRITWPRTQGTRSYSLVRPMKSTQQKVAGTTRHHHHLNHHLLYHHHQISDTNHMRALGHSVASTRTQTHKHTHTFHPPSAPSRTVR